MSLLSKAIAAIYGWWLAAIARFRGRRPTPVHLLAFLDESQRQNGVFVVAGVLFEETAALQFDAEWRALHGARQPFHMADLVGGRRLYKGLSQAERDILLRESVAVINRHRMIGFAVACQVQDFAVAAPDWARELSHAYTMCGHFCLALSSQWLSDHNDARAVSYFLEAGHEHASAADRLFHAADRFKSFRTLYQYHSHQFLGKNDATPLQAADLWAWEFAKYYDETHLQRLRPMRGSAIALMNGFLDRYKFVILERDRIERFYREWRQKADSVTAEEAQAALDSVERKD